MVIKALSSIQSYQAPSSTKKVDQKEASVVPMTGKTQKNGKSQKVKTPQFPEYDSKNYKSYEDYKQQKAKYYFKNDLKTGKLEYVEPTQWFGGKVQVGGRYYQYTPGKNETLGDIKSRYNLPDGYLKGQSLEDGGDRDKQKALPEIRIDEKAFKENGLKK